MNYSIKTNPQSIELAKLILQAIDLAYRHDLTQKEGPYANDRTPDGRCAAAFELLKMALGSNSEFVFAEDNKSDR